MIKWLLSLMPDKCELTNCKHDGVRGNEQLVETIGGYRMLMCDSCYARHKDQIKEMRDGRG